VTIGELIQILHGFDPDKLVLFSGEFGLRDFSVEDLVMLEVIKKEKPSVWTGTYDLALDIRDRSNSVEAIVI